MHEFIKVVGIIIAVIGAIIAGLSVATLSSSGPALAKAASIYGIIVGAGVALPGAMLFCFGAIVEHLIALRSISQRQVQIFEEMVKRRQP